MSFTITFYTNKSDNIKLDKDLQLKGTLRFADFRGDFDLLNPTIIVQTDDEDTVKNGSDGFYDTFAEDVMSGKINYFQIFSVRRFYYCVAYKMIHNNVIAIKLHEDVLYTRKNLIRSCTGIIRRNENLYNLYINDKAINTYSKPFIRRRFFNGTQGFSVENPSTFIIATGKPAVNRSDISYFDVVVSRNHSDSAQNGGACVFIPYAVETSTHCANFNNFYNTSLYITAVGSQSPDGGYVICPLSAIYGPYYNKNGNIYADEKFCIARITKATQIIDTDDPPLYNLELSIVKTFDYNTTLHFRSTISSSNFANVAKASVWSIGGRVDWALQNTGAVVAVNGIYPPISTTIQFARQVDLNPNGTNTLMFHTWW